MQRGNEYLVVPDQPLQLAQCRRYLRVTRPSVSVIPTLSLCNSTPLPVSLSLSLSLPHTLSDFPHTLENNSTPSLSPNYPCACLPARHDRCTGPHHPSGPGKTQPLASSLPLVPPQAPQMRRPNPHVRALCFQRLRMSVYQVAPRLQGPIEEAPRRSGLASPDAPQPNHNGLH